MRYFISLSMLFMIAGCQAALPLSSNAIVSAMADHVAGPPLPPGELVDAADTADVLRHSGAKRFLVVDGDGKGDRLVRRLTSKGSGDDRVAFVRELGNGQVQQEVSEAESGLHRLAAVEDSEHAALTRFEPALQLSWGAQGKAVTTEAKATVVKADDHSQQIDAGESNMTVTHDADQRIVTPAGTFDCQRIRTDYEGRFGMARVKSTRYQYFALEVGLVAEHYEEKGVALIVPWKKSHTIVRLPDETE